MNCKYRASTMSAAILAEEGESNRMPLDVISLSFQNNISTDLVDLTDCWHIQWYNNFWHIQWYNNIQWAIQNYSWRMLFKMVMLAKHAASTSPSGTDIDIYMES